MLEGMEEPALDRMEGPCRFVLDVVAFLAKKATTYRKGMRYPAESVGCGGIKGKKCHHI